MAREHAATGIHLVVGIPVVDVPVPIDVVPVDVDEHRAACVPEAIHATTHRMLSGLYRIWDLEVLQLQAPTCNKFLFKDCERTLRKALAVRTPALAASEPSCEST